MGIRKLLSIVVAVALAGTVGLTQGRGHSGSQTGTPGRSGAAPKGPKAGQGPAAKSGKPPSTGNSAGKRTVAQHLAAQPDLRARLQPLLPGTNLDQAASGFNSLGQFVAAVNVAHNVGISFDALKARVTGTSAVPLGQAIHDLRPGANAKIEAERAETEAQQMIRATGHK